MTLEPRIEQAATRSPIRWEIRRTSTSWSSVADAGFRYAVSYEEGIADAHLSDAMPRGCTSKRTIIHEFGQS